MQSQFLYAYYIETKLNVKLILVSNVITKVNKKYLIYKEIQRDYILSIIILRKRTHATNIENIEKYRNVLDSRRKVNIFGK